MGQEHHYKATIRWTGNKGEGTKDYRAYARDHIVSIENKQDILASSDPSFRGDKTRHNPEELLVVALSSCHMLWYLHLCAVAGVVVVDYIDQATGTMVETANGAGKFKEATLFPTVTVKESSMVEKANELHKKATEMCFIANSCNFPVHHKPTCIVANS
ncbi:MAG: OsmC family protein [Ignavibacteriales bacterium]|nr:OsmC family protein [Ignavibacteriales bacterium]